MNVAVGEAASRVAAIQQMATALGMGPQPAAGFQQALDAAQQPATAVPVAATGGSVSGMPYAAEINAAAAKHGIDPALLAGLVKQESGFNPTATSSAGARGLTQLMPATAKYLGVTDSTDPAQALDGGAKYLKEMLDKFGGDPRLALAAYNAGPGAVTRFGGVPPYAETKAYVEKVLANRDAYSAAATAAVPALGGMPATMPAAAVPSSNLSIGSSSTSAAYGSSSSLGYPTT
ncbi:MAG: lytic transglycosylase domain-containing protein [Solirubrobacteraceae bacterium]|nr:lytic transglycosylase domain-containing protein [Solirubrobacteraceae bacterium]